MMTVLVNRALRLFALLSPKPFDNTTPEGRARERHRRFTLSAATAAAAKLLSMGTVLITVPMTLNYLGPERYGMWMTIASFSIMLSFSDLGIGNGVLSAVADSFGRNDRPAIRNQVSSGFFFLCGIAVLLFLLFALIGPLFRWDRLFNVVSPLARQESAPALAVFILCFAIGMPFGIVQKVQIGLQQGFAANLWQCVGSLIGLAGVLAVIHFDGSVPWLIAAISGAPIFASILNFFLFFAVKAPDLAPNRNVVSGQTIGRMARIGLLFFVLQLIISVAFASDNIIIAQLLGASAVATYAVPEKMFALITSLIVLAVNPLWPAYTEAIARGDNKWVRKTFIRSMYFAVLAAAAGATVLVLFGREITALWVGHSINPPFLLLICFGVWKVLEAAGNALSIYLNGAGQLRMQVFLLAPMAICSIALKIALLPMLGLPGIVLATAFSYVIFVLIPWAYHLPKLLSRQERN
jgi:O-antigen/teichoic acid export membrane protein